MGPGEGARREPRALCWLLSSRQLSQLPGSDASSPLAREGAQNNPDSWGGGCALDTGDGLEVRTPGTPTWPPVVAS